MAKTKKITLFYTLTRDEIFPPSTSELRRKDEWVKGVQAEIAGPAETRQVKVTYEMHNPEIDKQRRFFNFEMMGYDLELPDGAIHRQRKSTASFQSVQKWHTFLEELRETMFEPNGYEMPDSEQFWELAEKHGYDQAQAVAIEQLQKKLQKKLSPQSTEQ